MDKRQFSKYIYIFINIYEQTIKLWMQTTLHFIQMLKEYTPLLISQLFINIILQNKKEQNT